MLFPLIFGIAKVVGCENSTLRTVIIRIFPILVVPEIVGSKTLILMTFIISSKGKTLILMTLIISSKGSLCSASIFNFDGVCVLY